MFSGDIAREVLARAVEETLNPSVRAFVETKPAGLSQFSRIVNKHLSTTRPDRSRLLLRPLVIRDVMTLCTDLRGRTAAHHHHRFDAALRFYGDRQAIAVG